MSPLSLSLSSSILLSLEARTPWGHTTVASAIVGSLSRSVTSRNGNRGQVYFSPCLITGGNTGGGSSTPKPAPPPSPLFSWNRWILHGRWTGRMGLIDPRVNLSWSGGEGSKVASSELGRLTDRLMSRNRVTHSRGNRRSLIILSKMGAGVDGVYAIIDRVRHSGLGQPRENSKNVYYVGLWIMYVFLLEYYP